jgi:serine/threonine protein kinase
VGPRLDLWLADHPGDLSAAGRLALLRQVAEAVAYAHANRVVHRGLTPHAVSVRPLPDGGMRVQVGDWQSAGAIAGPALTGLSGSGVTGLMGVSDEPSPAAGQPSALMRPGAVDVDRRLAEAF